MSYLGNTPTTQSFISGTDYFNGTGAQTAFTLSRTVASVNDIQAVVNNVVQVPNDAYTISGTTITFTSAPSAGTQNVYVRYLSTTTQAITPSQNTVSWNTLDTNTQQDLGISFKNRIINGNMAIDQRNAGASVTPANFDYLTDRWQFRASQGSKFTAEQTVSGVSAPTGFTDYLGMTSTSAYSVGSGEQFGIRQFIEGVNIYDLAWGTANARTVTLSFWVRSSLTGTHSGALGNSGDGRAYPFSFTVSTSNTWEYKTVTIPGDTTGTWLTTNGIGIKVSFNLGAGSSMLAAAGAWTTGEIVGATGSVSVVGTNGATFYLTGVQLEVGTQATTFTLAGGSYGAELALCHRYYYRVTNNGSTYTTFAIGRAYSSTEGNATVYMPVPMRASPTIGKSAFSGSNWDYSITAISIAQVASDFRLITVASTGAFTNGGAYALAAGNTTSLVFLDFSAEL